MRLLDRYLLRELFIMLGYCLGGLLILYIAFDLIAGLNRFQEHHLQLQDVAELYVVKLPGILVFLLPVTLLLALLYALTNHARHHELTAMRAAGVGLGRICLPYLVVGFLLSLIVFALNELWVPDTEAKQAKIMDRHLHQNPSADVATQQINLPFRNARDGRNWMIGAYNFKTDVMLNPHVYWKSQGADWDLLAERAEHNNGIWKFYGSTTFSTNDLFNLESFAAKLRADAVKRGVPPHPALSPKGGEGEEPGGVLKHPPTADGVSEYLKTRLSPLSLGLLEKYRNGANPDLQRSLANDLNRLIHRGLLYETERFAGVKLSPATTNLLAQKPQGAALMQLNRLLLADAYPQEISKESVYTVKLWKGDASTDFKTGVHLITNALAMPEFTETPREFANESKFTSRFTKLSADSAEVPIRELRDYLDLHPDLPQKYRWWLNTQLQGRYATPWACLVVVLIAIPFGAASGRRNIFVGVAGSIVICFVYFILLRLGLALGTGGFLPAWIAAWLPNAVFSIAGFWLMLRVR